MEKLNNLKEFKNYKDMSENSEEFKNGVRKYREGTAKITYNVEPVWISKVVKVKEWNNFYKYSDGYCYLEKVSEGVKMGFFITGIVPVGCELLTDEELVNVDNCYRANNIGPTPLKVLKSPSAERPEELEQTKIL